MKDIADIYGCYNPEKVTVKTRDLSKLKDLKWVYNGVDPWGTVIFFVKDIMHWDYKTNLKKWLSKNIKFSKIRQATFDSDWVLGSVEFDEEHTIYVLIPEAVFKKYPSNQLKEEG